MSHTVVFTPEARDDLLDLYDYIADRSSPARALGYIERIENTCMRLKPCLSEEPAARTCAPACA